MADIKKKPAARRAPAKKAAVKKAAVKADAAEDIDAGTTVVEPEPEQAGEMQPEPPSAEIDIKAMVASAVSDAIAEAVPQIIEAVTAKSPQVVPDAPVVESEIDIEILELTDPVAAQIARQDQSPGGKVIEAEPEVRNISRAEYDTLTDEEKRAYDNAQLQKVDKRKRAAAARRSEIAQMSTADRIRTLAGKRDPNVIRKAENPMDERMIKVQSINRIGLGEEGTSDVDEVIYVPYTAAKHLQEEGRIKVLI